VYDALHPSPRDDENEDERIAKERRGALREMGLIASDVAYPTWLRQQQGVRWPWTYSDTPERAARHFTRDLEFWSRQVVGLRGDPAWCRFRRWRAVVPGQAEQLFRLMPSSERQGHADAVGCLS
jgi:hypothetical protein